MKAEWKLKESLCLALVLHLALACKPTTQSQTAGMNSSKPVVGCVTDASVAQSQWTNTIESKGGAPKSLSEVNQRVANQNFVIKEFTNLTPRCSSGIYYKLLDRQQSEDIWGGVWILVPSSETHFEILLARVKQVLAVSHYLPSLAQGKEAFHRDYKSLRNGIPAFFEGKERPASTFPASNSASLYSIFQISLQPVIGKDLSYVANKERMAQVFDVGITVCNPDPSVLSVRGAEVIGRLNLGFIDFVPGVSTYTTVYHPGDLKRALETQGGYKARILDAESKCRDTEKKLNQN